MGKQRASWVKVRQPRGESNEKPTGFWLNLDRVTVVKAWPRVGESPHLSFGDHAAVTEIRTLFYLILSISF